MDEPTGNVDSKTAFGILDLIEKLNRDEKRTFIVVTHSQLLTQYTNLKEAVTQLTTQRDALQHKLTTMETSKTTLTTQIENLENIRDVVKRQIHQANLNFQKKKITYVGLKRAFILTTGPISWESLPLESILKHDL